MWIWIAALIASYAEPRAVIAASGLKVRAAPDPAAAVLGKAPYGAQVEVISLGEVVEVGGEGGRWAEVEWRGGRGYLFDRWLSAYLPAGDCPDLTSWADAALGEPVRVEVDVAEDCQCPERRITTARLYPGEILLSEEEGWQSHAEILAFPPTAPMRTEELWLLARACLHPGEGLPSRYPARGGWVETSTHLRVRLEAGDGGASLEALGPILEAP